MQRPKPTAPADGSTADGAPALLVRPAAPGDREAVERLLRDLDLDYRERNFAAFQVGELEGPLGTEIVGIAEVRRLDGCALLSCVGIRADLQGRGLGRSLVQGALRGVDDDVYLYTLVPGFFAALGFVDAPAPPPSLPAREIYACEACEPARCRRLVLRMHGR